MFKKIILLLCCGVMLFSCVGYKRLRYMTDLKADTTSRAVIDSSTAYRIKSGDVLYMKIVSSTDSKMELFNQSLSSSQNSSNQSGQGNLLSGVLVDPYGDIELPMAGLIKLSGLTLKEAEKKVNLKMSEFLNYVTVTVKLMSFRVSVIGEVASPGVKLIDRTAVSILDALAYAGDMTDMANRRKVRLIRREKNRNKVYTIDMSSANMLASEFYYLRPDDVLYVEPLKYKVVKVNSSTLSLGFSVFSIALAVFAVLSKK